MDLNASQRAVAVKFFVYYATQEGSCWDATSKVRSNRAEKPIPPRHAGASENFVHELEEETVVLHLKVLDPKTALSSSKQGLVPGDEATRAGAFVLTGPDKGPTPTVNGRDHSFVKREATNVVDREAVEDRVG